MPADSPTVPKAETASNRTCSNGATSVTLRTIVAAVTTPMPKRFRAAMSVICFNDGFYRDMKRVLIDQRVGHVQVHHPAYPGRRALHDTVADADSRVAALQQDETVGEVTARLRGQMLLAGDNKSEGAELQGVVPALEESFAGVSSMLVEGRFVGDEPAH